MMKIQVKNLQGLSLPLEVPKDAATVQVKRLIFKRLGVFPTDQQLIFQGRVMKDYETINEIGIHSGNVVYLATSTNSNIENPEVSLQQDADLLVKAKILAEYEREEFVEDNLALLSSPDSFIEGNRLEDIAFNNLESIPGGYLELIKNYKEMEEFMDEDINEVSAPDFTIIPAPASKPSDRPMPFIFISDDYDDNPNYEAYYPDQIETEELSMKNIWDSL